MRSELYEISQKQDQIIEELQALRNGDLGDATLGQRASDWIFRWLGSWTFIIGQGIIFASWITLNALQWVSSFDQFPFRFLSLILSLQAAFAVPVILMAQNRQEERDRRKAMEAYRAIERIEYLMTTVDEKVVSAKEKQENGES